MTLEPTSPFFLGHPVHNFQEGEGERGGVAVPLGGTPPVASPSPRALETNKRLVEGVRPAQLIPRAQTKQVGRN